MNNAADLTRFNLQAEKFNIAITDNTAATLCVIPKGRKCYGVVLVADVCASGNNVEALNWSIATGSVVVTPQISNNSTGRAEFLVLFRR